VVDVFFVKDVFGLKIEHETKLNEIRKSLFRVLEDGEAARVRAMV
jgi:[protein-PII] uridylyltransferase